MRLLMGASVAPRAVKDKQMQGREVQMAEIEAEQREMPRVGAAIWAAQRAAVEFGAATHAAAAGQEAELVAGAAALAAGRGQVDYPPAVPMGPLKRLHATRRRWGRVPSTSTAGPTIPTDTGPTARASSNTAMVGKMGYGTCSLWMATAQSGGRLSTQMEKPMVAYCTRKPSNQVYPNAPEGQKADIVFADK